MTAGKKLCGKAIPRSDDTYLTTVKLRDSFIQLKKFLTIKQTKPRNQEKIGALKNVVSKLQEDLQKQQIISQTVTEENIKIKSDLQDLKDKLSRITESRRESDEIMNRLFEDKDFKEFVTGKLKELT